MCVCVSAAEPLSALRALSSHNNYDNSSSSVKLFAFQTFVDDIFHENFNVFCRFFFLFSFCAFAQLRYLYLYHSHLGY